MSLQAELASMPDEEFEQHRASLITHKSDRPKRLSSLANSHWDEIRSEQYNFDRDIVEIEALRQLTRAQLIDFFDRHIAFGGRSRRKLSVRVYANDHLSSTATPDADEERFDDTSSDLIDDISQFKQRHQFFGHAEPYAHNVPPKGASPLNERDGNRTLTAKDKL
jgi:insulysin